LPTLGKRQEGKLMLGGNPAHSHPTVPKHPFFNCLRERDKDAVFQAKFFQNIVFSPKEQIRTVFAAFLAVRMFPRTEAIVIKMKPLLKLCARLRFFVALTLTCRRLSPTKLTANFVGDGGVL
jgi:hypothetical protein